MADLLLEIGVEELPSGAVEMGVRQIEERAVSLLRAARLTHGDVKVLGTPRRLTMVVDRVADHQDEAVSEVKGPPKKAAFVDDKPGPAAVGFAKSQGVDVDDLTTRDVNGGEYLFAVRRDRGRPATALLPDLLSQLVSSISFPRSMRWDRSGVRFARPVRWLLALSDDKPIPFSFGTVESGTRTWGHRLLRPESFEVKAVGDYFKVMADGKIIPDHAERRSAINRGISETLKDIGQMFKVAADPVVNPHVLDEVVQLVEWPSVVWGRFEEAFLAVPEEVLISAMESHQRYFAVRSGDGLLPAFVVVHNGNAEHEKIIRSGHERVLGTRLADAKFFFEADRESTLAEKAEDLKNVVFQEQLGTLEAKSRRVHSVGRVIAPIFGMEEGGEEDLGRAALLAKADLVTELVNEFPNLQGVMGRVYARLSGETDAVCDAIYDHYLPRGAEDELPQTMLGRVLSVADKIDTIVGCFSIGLIPTGSEDPYSLRRQTQGIISILLSTEVELELETLVSASIECYEDVQTASETAGNVLDFFRNRLRNHFLSAGFAHDVVSAVVGARLGAPWMIKKRLEALRSAGEKRMVELHTIFVRCNNLSRGVADTTVEESLLIEEEEKAVYAAVNELEPKVESAAAAGEYDQVLEHLVSLGPTVSSLFDAVLIVAEDEKVRRNRLALLAKLRDLFLAVADFSQIVIEGS